MLVAIISDSHNLLRPELIESLQDVELILHAGDICNKSVLTELEKIAPLRAVLGNCDSRSTFTDLHARESIELAGHFIHMLHDLNELDLIPEVSGIHLVITGHTHMPINDERNGVLYLNPGSVGPPRPGTPISFVKMRFESGVPLAPQFFKLSEGSVSFLPFDPKRI